MKSEKVEYFEGSILDENAVSKASKGVDGIFHLAAVVIHSRLPEHAETVRRSAITGTLNVMRAAKRTKCRVVYASTSGTVGCSVKGTIAHDNSPYCNPVVIHWPYYVAKIEAEMRAKKYAKEHDIELIIIRPSMMLGPEDDRFRSTHTILSYLNRRIPVVLKGGLSFVDVRDVAKAFKTAMEKGKPGESYLLGSQNLTLQKFFENLESISGVPKPTISLPYPVTYGIVQSINFFNRKILRQWDPGFDPVKVEMASHFWYISAEKAKKDLGFDPIDPMQTLKDTVEWIKKNNTHELHKASLKAKL